MAGWPRRTAFTLPTQPAGRGDLHLHASEGSGTCCIISGSERESTPSSRAISPASRPGAGGTPPPRTAPVPPQPRTPSLENSPGASVTCRPRAENQGGEGGGQGLCLGEPAEVPPEYSALTKHTPQSKSAPDPFGQFHATSSVSPWASGLLTTKGSGRPRPPPFTRTTHGGLNT